MGKRIIYTCESFPNSSKGRGHPQTSNNLGTSAGFWQTSRSKIGQRRGGEGGKGGETRRQPAAKAGRIKKNKKRVRACSDQQNLPLRSTPPHLVHGWSVGLLAVAASVHDVPDVAVDGLGVVHVHGRKTRVRVALDPLSYGLSVAGPLLGENLGTRKSGGVHELLKYLSETCPAGRLCRAKDGDRRQGWRYDGGNTAASGGLAVTLDRPAVGPTAWLSE